MSNDLSTDVYKFFCRHLVGLSVAYRWKIGEERNLLPRFSISSGTLISIHEVICFLTAGHVLKELEELRASDQIEIVGSTLVDTSGLNCVSNIPIPFDLRNVQMFYRDNDELGLDFGVIILDPYYVRLLAKNGRVAVSEKNWINQEGIEFEEYAMLGYPQEFTSERLSTNGECNVAPTMIPVRRLAAAPKERRPTRYPQFVAQLSPALKLNSVKGMSGGPILGFCTKKDTQYWIVALQSSWDPVKRIIYGCPLPIIGEWLTRWAKEPASP